MNTMRIARSVLFALCPIAGLLAATAADATQTMKVILQQVPSTSSHSPWYYCFPSENPSGYTFTGSKVTAWAWGYDTPTHIYAFNTTSDPTGTTTNTNYTHTLVRHRVSLGDDVTYSPNIAVGPQTSGWVSDFNTGANVSAIQNYSLWVTQQPYTRSTCSAQSYGLAFNAFSGGS